MVDLAQGEVKRPRAIVLGGAGFLGAHLCDRLIAEGFEVLCVDSLLTGQFENVQHLEDHSRFAFVQHDVTTPMDLPDLLRRAKGELAGTADSAPRADYILHFASPASPKAYAEHPIHTLKLGSVTVHPLGMAGKYGSVFLLASTSEVYGDPEISPRRKFTGGM